MNYVAIVNTCWVLARVWICPWTTCAPETGWARRMYCSWPVFSCTYNQPTQGGDKVWFRAKVIGTQRSQPFSYSGQQQRESFTLLWWIVNLCLMIPVKQWRRIVQENTMFVQDYNYIQSPLLTLAYPHFPSFNSLTSSTTCLSFFAQSSIPVLVPIAFFSRPA